MKNKFENKKFLGRRGAALKMCLNEKTMRNGFAYCISILKRPTVAVLFESSRRQRISSAQHVNKFVSHVQHQYSLIVSTIQIEINWWIKRNLLEQWRRMFRAFVLRGNVERKIKHRRRHRLPRRRRRIRHKKKLQSGKKSVCLWATNKQTVWHVLHAARIASGMREKCCDVKSRYIYKLWLWNNQ